VQHHVAGQTFQQALRAQLFVRNAKGEAMDKTLDWAAKEIEGFSRN